MDWSLIRDEVTWIIILGVTITYQLAYASKHTLLIVIVMILFGYISWMYLTKKQKEVEQKSETNKETIVKDTKNKKEINSENFFVATFPKKDFKYLFKNPTMYDICKDLFFVRIYDKAAFSELLLLMEKTQKEYMYILASRRDDDLIGHITIFLDLSKSVLRVLYQLYFVVPRKAKHIYNLSPYKVIESNIDKFHALRREMILTLESFVRKEKKLQYFPEQSPEPFEAKKHELP